MLGGSGRYSCSKPPSLLHAWPCNSASLALSLSLQHCVLLWLFQSAALCWPLPGRSPPPRRRSPLPGPPARRGASPVRRRSPSPPARRPLRSRSPPPRRCCAASEPDPLTLTCRACCIPVHCIAQLLCLALKDASLNIRLSSPRSLSLLPC